MERIIAKFSSVKNSVKSIKPDEKIVPSKIIKTKSIKPKIPPHKTLMLAFGSGGASGLGSLGVMSVLHKHNIYPAAVSGTSMGSVIAAYYGIHGETETLREWFNTRSAYHYFFYAGGPTKKALISAEKLEIVLDELFDHKNFEDAVLPVRIVAVNLRTGEEKVFTKGSLINAVMASCALPGIIPARKIGEEYYVDGGTINPTPFDVYPKSKYDHILAIDFHFHIPDKLDELGLLDTFKRAIFIAPHYAFMQRFNRYKSKCTLLKLTKKDDGVLNFTNGIKYMEDGEKAAEELIETWKKNGLYDELRSK